MARRNTTPWHLVGALAIAAALLAGCSAPYQKNPTALEPRHIYPLTVESQVVTLDVIGDGNGRPLPAEAVRLDQLVDDYAVSGATRLVVQTSRAHGALGDGLALGVASRALARGLARPEVVVVDIGAADGPVTVSFERHLVRLPDCAGWNVEPSYNPSNSPHINFGCATQRNLGMMVANPAHLVAPAGQGGVLDSMRSDLVIGKYRKGDLTTATKSEELVTTVSEVAQ
ncbi:MAG: CpaD family pilus assembly lipoprotein [Alphaproteobacteria bacterium]